MLQAKVEGNELVIRIPMDTPPRSSATGKTMVVASTRGNAVTSCIVNGKPLTVGLNAYYSLK